MTPFYLLFFKTLKIMTGVAYVLYDGTEINVNEDQICYTVAGDDGFMTIQMSNGQMLTAKKKSSK